MIKDFRFWCQKVLPLVYDESLSYYEVLCKMADYLNTTIVEVNQNDEDIASIKQTISQIQEWIDNFDTSYVAELIEKYIATMIFVEINDDGYIVYNIPYTWRNITFNTTELDIVVESEREYGHLVLSY